MNRLELRKKLSSYDVNWVIPNWPGLAIHFLPESCVDDLMDLFDSYAFQFLEKALPETAGRVHEPGFINGWNRAIDQTLQNAKEMLHNA